MDYGDMNWLAIICAGVAYWLLGDRHRLSRRRLHCHGRYFVDLALGDIHKCNTARFSNDFVGGGRVRDAQPIAGES